MIARIWRGMTAASNADESRRVCAKSTLSSDVPWMMSSGRSSFGASAMIELRS